MPDDPSTRTSHARRPAATAESETWRDYPLAEIDELIAELKIKVARFTFFRSLQFGDENSEPGNGAAFESMMDALEDISAAALGIELASHQEFLRIRPVTRP
ncbi:hypothetical protein GCM10023346_42490 [Arthrobacter gyeryongensis]|uniref:Uncharacterized protein n=1 Tax=Arthrobacter gyeryongensis TaxID=1650592 RepID=A0ABP9SR78_9MICC